MPEFEVIYKEYFRDVYKYVYTLCRDESLAEEITQESFCKALDHLDRFDGRCRLFVWLCQIAKNTYYTYQKRQKRYMTELETDTCTQTEQSFESELIDRENVRQLQLLLRTLPELYREVFSLRVFGEFAFAQIGALFGKSDSWARLIFFRAKQELRRGLDEDSL